MFFEDFGLTRDEFVELMEAYSAAFTDFFVTAKQMFRDGERLLEDNEREGYDFYSYIEEQLMQILARINFEAFKKLSVDELMLLDTALYDMLHSKHNIASNVVVGTLIRTISDVVEWFFNDDLIKDTAPPEMLQEIENEFNTYYEGLIEEDIKMYEDIGMDAFELHEVSEKQNDYMRNEYEKYAGTAKRIKTHFMGIQSRTLNFLVSQNTKEEKIYRIHEYHKVLDNIDQGIYYIDNEEIEIISSEKIYQSLTKDVVLNNLDFYFDEQELSINTCMESVTHLFIEFHALRLDGTEKNKDSFLKSMRLFVDGNFKNSTYKVMDEELESKYKLGSSKYWVYNIKYCFYKIYDFYMKYENNIRAMNNENKLKDIKTNDFILSQKYNGSYEYNSRIYDIKKYYSYESGQYEIIYNNTSGREREQIKTKMDKRNEEITKLILDNDSADACMRMAVSLEAVTLLKEAFTIILQHEEWVEDYVVLEITNMKDTLSNIIYDIIGIIYFNPGLYYDLRQRKNQDLSIISNDEYHLERLKIWRSMYEEALRAAVDQNITEIMKLRLNYVQMFKKNNMPGDEVERVINEIIHQIKKKAEKQPEYLKFYEITKKYLEKYSKILTNDIIMTISTAEFLYNQFIVSSVNIKEFDYSCISILYYQALEDAYNHLIYRPYVKEVIEPNLDDIVYRMKNYDIDSANPRGKGYFPDASLGHLIKFDKIQRKYYVESSCMFGPFSIVLNNFAHRPDELFRLRDFLIKRFNVKNLDKEKMKDFSRGLGEAAKYRNNAAHGGRIIFYHEVERDKTYVFEKNNIENFKLLLNKLLQFFNIDMI